MPRGWKRSSLFWSLCAVVLVDTDSSCCQPLNTDKHPYSSVKIAGTTFILKMIDTFAFSENFGTSQPCWVCLVSWCSQRHQGTVTPSGAAGTCFWWRHLYLLSSLSDLPLNSVRIPIRLRCGYPPSCQCSLVFNHKGHKHHDCKRNMDGGLIWEPEPSLIQMASVQGWRSLKVDWKFCIVIWQFSCKSNGFCVKTKTFSCNSVLFQPVTTWQQHSQMSTTLCVEHPWCVAMFPAGDWSGPAQVWWFLVWSTSECSLSCKQQNGGPISQHTKLLNSGTWIQTLYKCLGDFCWSNGPNCWMNWHNFCPARTHSSSQLDRVDGCQNAVAKCFWWWPAFLGVMSVLVLKLLPFDKFLSWSQAYHRIGSVCLQSQAQIVLVLQWKITFWKVLGLNILMNREIHSPMFKMMTSAVFTNLWSSLGCRMRSFFLQWVPWKNQNGISLIWVMCDLAFWPWPWFDTTFTPCSSVCPTTS